ncbi:MarR family transcriptional regulator [bacterium]|nr:MarR family transcriptional regulator [bacterium]
MQNDDRLLFFLSKAQHKLEAFLKKSLLSQNIKITAVQSGILFLLKRRSHTMTELSKELSIDNSAITGLVDRLEKSGFAERKINPDDRRTFLISITPQGFDEINRAKVIIRRVNEQIKEGFSEEEMDIFKRVLDRFFTKFDAETIPKN